MYKKFLALLLLACTATALLSHTGCGHTMQYTATLAAGETVSKKINNRMVAMKVAHIADSRCPANANCIRAGEATVQVMLYSGTAADNATLCTGADCKNKMPVTVTLDGERYRLQLMAVTPAPTADNNNTAVKKAVISVAKEGR